MKTSAPVDTGIKLRIQRGEPPFRVTLAPAPLCMANGDEMLAIVHHSHREIALSEAVPPEMRLEALFGAIYQAVNPTSSGDESRAFGTFIGDHVRSIDEAGGLATLEAMTIPQRRSRRSRRKVTKP